MKKEITISATEFCRSHNIENAFLNDIREAGLIEFDLFEKSIIIRENRLPDLERVIHLHFDLDINLEGIETIIYLLNRSEQLQDEIINLRNRLSLYEDI